MYIHAYVYIYVYIYMYTYIYTHIHTPAKRPWNRWSREKAPASEKTCCYRYTLIYIDMVSIEIVFYHLYPHLCLFIYTHPTRRPWTRWSREREPAGRMTLIYIYMCVYIYIYIYIYICMYV